MSDYLTNQFLIAMPALASGIFAQTVTYMCEHNDKGAMGIVINRPLKMVLGDVFEQYKLPTDRSRWAAHPVLRGGPLQQDQGFVIHRAGGPWDKTILVSDQVHVTTSRDILDAMANGGGPQEAFVALGYAEWDAGQLESELSQNSWLTVPADERILFDTPYEQRWLAAGRLLGVNLTMMSQHAGARLTPLMGTAPPPQHAAHIVLGFDFGTRRIGVAAGDTITRTARPVATVQVDRAAVPAGVEKLIKEYAPQQLVVGVPYNMDGTETALTQSSMQFARELTQLTGLPVACVDERLSSREAEAELRSARAAGLKAKRVTHGDVDRIAARIVLQRWFDGEGLLPQP